MSKLGSFSVTGNCEDIGLAITLNVWLIAVIVIVVFVFLLVKYRQLKGQPNLKLTEIKLNVGGQELAFSVERNFLNLEIAHKIYIELITRKAALPFDEKDDIIEEVYNSWYSLFGTTRDEIKAINGELLEHPTSETLIKMATDVLNNGLRPHLTKYQGRFRRWYSNALQSEKYKGVAPQEVQRNFPEYQALVESMKEVNILLSNYAAQLHLFIYGQEDEG
ncbi:MAG: hypothetical protein JKY87_00835 [Mariprofundus sp.]|nr:hypothetical protein [Mariprofundus sp.]